MSRKFIFSQMFDVRPRKKSGDLDVDKIEKIVKILNLKPEDIEDNIVSSEKIIDLKNQPMEIYIEKEPPKKRGRKPKKIEIKERGMSSFDFWPEYNEESDLTQGQAAILSVLEMVEEADQALKNQEDKGDNIKDIDVVNNNKEVFYEIPIKTSEPMAEEPVTVEAVESRIAPEVNEVISIDYDAPLTPSVIRGVINPFSSNNKGDTLDLLRERLEFSNPDAKIKMTRKDFFEPEQSFLSSDVVEGGQPSQNERVFQSLEPTPYLIKGGTRGDFLDNKIIAPELLLNKGRKTFSFNWRKGRKTALALVAAAVLVISFFPILNWFNRVLIAKNEALNSGMLAYQSLISAKQSLEQFNFSQAEKDFKIANDYFSAADSQIRGVAGWLVFILERIPGVSYFSSRTKLVKVGQDMSKAGQSFASIVSLLGSASLDISKNEQGQAPISGDLTKARSHLEDGLRLLVSAKQDLEDINISSLPKDIQPNLVLLEDKMPQIVETAALALDWADNFLKIIGSDRAKNYLLVFQNNAEARPTGGFIGTYGVLEINQGQIKNLLVDGIYNPDGQLKEKVIPPVPIQKVATAWSTHDANWFADFPLSAQKIMWFYEKTGGETPDGVISLTPTLIERLLKITGPIDMPEYGVSLNSENFVDAAQQEIEIDYDKILNQPKKILADFAPKFIDKVVQEIKNNNLDVLKTINQALKEKHILVYFSDSELEQFVKGQGWAGEIAAAERDYLAVINTNINGYKTDRVVKEDINYVSEIQDDGSTINTVSVTRRHQGGSFDWYNKVNADYLRVYVPKGAELLSVSGQTREEVKPPIDYIAAGFKTDSDVLAQGQNMKIDQASGTQIFEESGKTVFGNWVYVSPGESVTLTYKYRLPFKLDISKPAKFSLIAQKQSGSLGSGFSGEIKFPSGWKILQSSLDFIKIDGNLASWESDLMEDRILEIKLAR